MPLVLLCGFPASGKSTRTKELKQIFESYIASLNEQGGEVTLRPEVVVIDEQSTGVDRHRAFSSSTEEKNARALIFSAVERHLTTETIVICDYLNYIKGYRYQLYCVSRNIGTSYCVMFCACTPEDSIKFNLASNAYSPEVHADLVTRFEEPEGRNRWDSPLFTVLPSDPPLDTSHPIVSAIVHKTNVRPNLSTVVKPLTETNYLAEMDALVSSIIQAILDAQKGGGAGQISVPRSSVKVVLPGRAVSLSELRRIKRQFGNINKIHTAVDLDKVAQNFVEYVNRALG